MKAIYKLTLLKESFRFRKPISKLKDKIELESDRSFYFDWTSESEFKIEAKFSVHPITMNYPGFFGGIIGYGKLKEVGNGETQVDLISKFRKEIFIAVLLPLVFVIINLSLTKSERLSTEWIIGIFLISFSCLLIYRFQEKILFRSLRKYLDENKT